MNQPISALETNGAALAIASAPNGPVMPQSVPPPAISSSAAALSAPLNLRTGVLMLPEAAPAAPRFAVAAPSVTAAPGQCCMHRLPAEDRSRDRKGKRQRLDTGTKNGQDESEMNFHDALDAVVLDCKEAAQAVGDSDVDTMLAAVKDAKRIVTFGVGREGLVLKAFAMRLHHLGFKATPAFEMNTPPLGSGDLLLLSNGPGSFVTVEAMAKLAEKQGVVVITFTYNEDAEVSTRDLIVIEQPGNREGGPRHASDLSSAAAPNSAGLLGSTYEAALTLVLDTVALLLAADGGITDTDLRTTHTNLE